MSQVAQIRAALVAALSAVPGAGIVHERERYARDEGQFRALYLYTPPGGGAPHIRGWWLRRVATRESAPDIGPANIQRHRWEVRGYMAFDDAGASEIAFDELIEAMRAAIRADVTLGGVCAAGPIGEEGEEGLQLESAGPVIFAGALCHSALMTFTTWSYDT